MGSSGRVSKAWAGADADAAFLEEIEAEGMLIRTKRVNLKIASPSSTARNSLGANELEDADTVVTAKGPVGSKVIGREVLVQLAGIVHVTEPVEPQ